MESVVRVNITNLDPKHLLKRSKEAAEQALDYLEEDPPRIRDARETLKAAIQPERLRWSDP